MRKLEVHGVKFEVELDGEMIEIPEVGFSQAYTLIEIESPDEEGWIKSSPDVYVYEFLFGADKGEPS